MGKGVTGVSFLSNLNTTDYSELTAAVAEFENTTLEESIQDWILVTKEHSPVKLGLLDKLLSPKSPGLGRSYYTAEAGPPFVLALTDEHLLFISVRNWKQPVRVEQKIPYSDIEYTAVMRGKIAKSNITVRIKLKTNNEYFVVVETNNSMNPGRADSINTVVERLSSYQK